MANSTSIRAIIVDDELNCLENLQLLLTEFCPEVTLVGKAASLIEARKLINSTAFEIAFLDIQIGSDSIFTLLREYPNPAFQIIFVTAYDHYALRAFEFMAIDYLLKPIEVPKLINSIRRSRSVSDIQHQGSALQQVMLQLRDLNRDQHKIAIPTNQGFDMLNVREIMYCLADGSYTHLHLHNQPKQTASKNLKHYERLLEDYGFIRSHPSCLINPKYIRSIERMNGGNVIMDDGEVLPISKTKRLELEEIIRNNHRL